MAHFGSRDNAPSIEPFAREAHNLLVHPVLHRQKSDRLRMVGCEAFHQRLPEPPFQGFVTLYDRGELAMVARKDNSSGSPHRNPGCGFESLSRLIDEERGEFLAVKQAACAPCECGGYDMCVVEKVVVDAYFQLCGSSTQAVHLLMPLV